MTHVLVIVLALLIGVIAGLRALTAPAVVAWGAFLGWIDLDGKWSEWVAHPITVTVLTIFLLVELVTDQLPKTPESQDDTAVRRPTHHGRVRGRGDRQRVLPHVQRARCRHHRCGAGHAGRGCSQARRFWSANGGQDLPVALVEDVVAVGGGFLVAFLVSLV